MLSFVLESTIAAQKERETARDRKREVRIMFSSKKPAMNSHDQAGPLSCPLQGDSGLVLTTDPKPRLRWTVELHDRFADAVNQLGGPDKATPKTIMRVMGVKGLTLYHLKSHLQKFRLGKQPHKEFNEHSKDALDMHRNGASSSGFMSRNMNDRNAQTTEALRMQLEVQKRLQEQLEVQKSLQMRIEAQGKYMHSILERACRTLAACENNQSTPDTYKTYNTSQEIMAFPSSFQDLHLFSNHDHSHQINMHQQDDTFFTENITDDLCLGKKIRPHDFYSIHPTDKGPLMWADDQSCKSTAADHHQLQISASVIHGGLDVESMMEAVYDQGCRKTPLLSPERAAAPAIRGGGLNQARNLSYG